MKKYSFFLLAIAFILAVGAISGCDNRSQLEKDMDSAADDINQRLR